MAMEVDQAIAFMSQQDNLEAYIIYFDDKGKTTEFMTDGFKNVLLK
jgi:thiamine biosynthesis lipoprotein